MLKGKRKAEDPLKSFTRQWKSIFSLSFCHTQTNVLHWRWVNLRGGCKEIWNWWCEFGCCDKHTRKGLTFEKTFQYLSLHPLLILLWSWTILKTSIQLPYELGTFRLIWKVLIKSQNTLGMGMWLSSRILALHTGIQVWFLLSHTENKILNPEKFREIVQWTCWPCMQEACVWFPALHGPRVLPKATEHGARNSPWVMLGLT